MQYWQAVINSRLASASRVQIAEYVLIIRSSNWGAGFQIEIGSGCLPEIDNWRNGYGKVVPMQWRGSHSSGFYYTTFHLLSFPLLM